MSIYKYTLLSFKKTHLMLNNEKKKINLKLQ